MGAGAGIEELIRVTEMSDTVESKYFLAPNVMEAIGGFYIIWKAVRFICVRSILRLYNKSVKCCQLYIILTQT